MDLHLYLLWTYLIDFRCTALHAYFQIASGLTKARFCSSIRTAIHELRLHRRACPLYGCSIFFGDALGNGATCSKCLDIAALINRVPTCIFEEE